MFTGFYARKTNTDDILDKNSYAIILNVKKENDTFTTHVAYNDSNTFDKGFHSFMVNNLRLLATMLGEFIDEPETRHLPYKERVDRLKKKYTIFEPEWDKDYEKFLEQNEEDEFKDKKIFKVEKEQ